MSGFSRFAVYHLPDDPALAAFGAAWLGWDAVSGKGTAHPDVAGIDLAVVTEAPRRYGFHATLKPPFRLAEGTTPGALANATAALAATLAPVCLDGLGVATLGRFIALVPDGDTGALDALAFRAVADLDAFRAPARPAEVERRRAAGLTERQDALLRRWGYPYVCKEFRFHMTLSGPLGPAALGALRAAAVRHVPPLPRPYEIASIALAGERPDGRFQLIHRYALTG